MAKTHYQKLVELVAENNTDECIVWPYRTHRSGHGELIHPETNKNVQASRVSFELTNGYLPPVVRHQCDNPPCINPKHLLAGTHQDNVKDRVERDRSARGVDNGRSKLTEFDAMEIYLSTDPIRQLARDYQVDRNAIKCIKQEKTWVKAIDSLRDGNHVSVTIFDYEPETREVNITTKNLSL